MVYRNRQALPPLLFGAKASVSGGVKVNRERGSCNDKRIMVKIAKETRQRTV